MRRSSPGTTRWGSPGRSWAPSSPGGRRTRGATCSSTQRGAGDPGRPTRSWAGRRGSGGSRDECRGRPVRQALRAVFAGGAGPGGGGAALGDRAGAGDILGPDRERDEKGFPGPLRREEPPSDAHGTFLRCALGGAAGDFPRFDAILLGLGADGHTASLFPGSFALEEEAAWVVQTEGGNPPAPRGTLTLPALNAASQVIFLVSGKEKARVLGEVLSGGGGERPAPRGSPRRRRGAVPA